jgi:hypothetical protein
VQRKSLAPRLETLDKTADLLARSSKATWRTPRRARRAMATTTTAPATLRGLARGRGRRADPSRRRGALRRHRGRAATTTTTTTTRALFGDGDDVETKIDDPLLRRAVKEPIAFFGGMAAGMFGLDVGEDGPLKRWVEDASGGGGRRGVEDAAAAAAATAATTAATTRASASVDGFKDESPKSASAAAAAAAAVDDEK